MSTKVITGNGFDMKTIIQDYLDIRANEDETFAPMYAKPNKSIDRCCQYIMDKAKEFLRSKDGMIMDEVVFGWAVDYYDEDDLEIDKPKPTQAAKPVKPTTGNLFAANSNKVSRSESDTNPTKIVQMPKNAATGEKNKPVKEFETLSLW